MLLRAVAGAIVLSLAASLSLAAMPATALACSAEEEVFEVTAPQLAGDFNTPDSRLARDYRTWYGRDDVSIEVLGAYVVETIHSTEPADGWSRGSVSTVFEVWGKWPEDTSPRSIAPQKRSGEPPDECGWGPAGQPMGTRQYMLVTTDGIVTGQGGDAMAAALADAFGPAQMADRDFAEEERLIAALQAARRGSSRGIALALAGIVVFGSILAYQYRHRRLAKGWEEIRSSDEASELG